MATSVELFNKLLKESLDEENKVIDNNNNNDDEGICLISGEPLECNHITLICNHKFNYAPLQHTTIHWKENFKNKSYCRKNNISLERHTICPYCRSVTKGLLPWYRSMGIPKRKNINTPAKFCFITRKCKHVFLSGKQKGKLCNRQCRSYDSNKPYQQFLCKQHEHHHNKYDDVGNLKQVNTVDNDTHSSSSEGDHFCQHVLLRGARKGALCAKKSKDYVIKDSDNTKLYYCKYHFSKIIKKLKQ